MSEFKHTYAYTVCPQCKADLTQPESVEIEGMNNEGESAGTSRTSLDTEGVLQDDPAGILTAGFHAGTHCAACGEYLDDLEII